MIGTAVSIFFLVEIFQGANKDGPTNTLQQRTKEAARKVWLTPSRLIQDLKKDRAVRLAGLDKLDIEIKFKDLEKIKASRSEALAAGVLLTDSDSFVPAYLTFDRERIPVRMRLKGDLMDHLRSDKWSFRIKVLGSAALFGMRAFSLQAPETRNYQTEPIINEYFHKEGLLAPRWRFVDLSINGNRVGVMYLEEHISREMFESQGRTEGIVLGFDDSRLWKSKQITLKRARLQEKEVKPLPRLKTLFHFPIKIFQENTVLRDPKLRHHARTAVGLLRGYYDGVLSTEEVFKLPELSRFMAAVTLWQTFHPFGINNMRFYFDPIVNLFEPVLYDSAAFSFVPPLLRDQEPDDDPLIQFARITLHPFVDPNFIDMYEKDLEELCTAVTNYQAAEWLASLESSVLKQLQPDYGKRERNTIDLLKRNATAFTGHRVKRTQRFGQLEEGELPVFDKTQTPVIIQSLSQFPDPVDAALFYNDETSYLEFRNLTSLRLRVRSIYHPKSNTELIGKDSLILEPSPDAAGGSLRLPVARSLIMDNANFEFTVEDLSSTHSATSRSNVSFAELRKKPFAPDLNKVSLDKDSPVTIIDGKTAEIRSGSWTVLEDISLPAGFRLTIRAGATLQFAPGVRMIVRGPLSIMGEERLPIRFESINPGLGWRGLIVMQSAQDASEITHAEFKDVKSSPEDDWPLTGGVTLTGGSFRLKNVSFLNAQIEDALHIYRAKFDVSDAVFLNSSSDALDIDFGSGFIHSSNFSGVGGDAIDLSGTKARISWVVIDNVIDKGISVGEQSSVNVDNVTISNAGTGLACKDGSLCEVKLSAFHSIRYNALMSYQKKKEYSYAKLDASEVSFDETGICCIAQRGSSLKVNGNYFSQSDLDVDSLYKTGYMRK